MSKRIALFGGSFNPIHHGHLISARAIAEQMSLTRVVLIPCARPPHKPNVPLIEGHHRLEMIRLAIAGEPLFDVDDLELHREGPSYTIDTVSAYRAKLEADAGLFWIVGADALRDLHTWRKVEELVNSVQIVSARRPGVAIQASQELVARIGSDAAGKLLEHACPTPQIEISATDIRQRVARGSSISFLVPEAVKSYIFANQLYIAAD